jgi:hypothetical protein
MTSGRAGARISQVCGAAALIGAALAVAAMSAAQEPAPEAPPTRTPASGPEESHGWVVVRGVLDESQYVLLHIPPRRDVPVGGGRTIRVSSGTVRRAAGLVRPPEFIASWGRRAFLVFPPERDREPGHDRRQILAIGAVPGSVQDRWKDDAGPRLAPVAAVPAGRETIGVVGTRYGPTALIRTVDDSGRLALRLLRLEGRRWVDLEAPAGVDPSDKSVALIAWEGGEGVGVALVSQEEGLALWTLARGPEGRLVWSARRFGDAQARTGGGLIGAGNRVIHVERDAEGVFGVSELSALGAWVGLARIRDIPADFSHAVLEDGARLVLVFPEAAEAHRGQRGVRHYRIVEVSLTTGRILYSGPIHGDGPVSPWELRVLIAVLFLLMVAILLFVLRSEGRNGVVLLPPGAALAEPPRRIVATILDVGLALLVARRVVGIELSVVASDPFSMPALETLLAVLATGFVLATLSEWLLGRSLGKWVTGCYVVVAGRAEGGGVPWMPPGLARSLLRNVVKWAMAPLTLVAIADPNGRHPGDILARTVVVVRFDTPERKQQG